MKATSRTIGRLLAAFIALVEVGLLAAGSLFVLGL